MIYKTSKSALVQLDDDRLVDSLAQAWTGLGRAGQGWTGWQCGYLVRINMQLNLSLEPSQLKWAHKPLYYLLLPI